MKQPRLQTTILTFMVGIVILFSSAPSQLQAQSTSTAAKNTDNAKVEVDKLTSEHQLKLKNLKAREAEIDKLKSQRARSAIAKMKNAAALEMAMAAHSKALIEVTKAESKLIRATKIFDSLQKDLSEANKTKAEALEKKRLAEKLKEQQPPEKKPVEPLQPKTKDQKLVKRPPPEQQPKQPEVTPKKPRRPKPKIIDEDRLTRQPNKFQVPRPPIRPIPGLWSLLKKSKQKDYSQKKYSEKLSSFLFSDKKPGIHKEAVNAQKTQTIPLSDSIKSGHLPENRNKLRRVQRAKELYQIKKGGDTIRKKLAPKIIKKAIQKRKKRGSSFPFPPLPPIPGVNF